jgi:hypothetical protein
MKNNDMSNARTCRVFAIARGSRIGKLFMLGLRLMAFQSTPGGWIEVTKSYDQGGFEVDGFELPEFHHILLQRFDDPVKPQAVLLLVDDVQ